MLDNFILQHKLPASFAETATQWFIPVTKELSSNLSQKKPFFIGINGCQGSGKSTLADFIAQYFTEHFAVSVAVISLDDFYLTSQRRQLLAKDIHPLLSTRGVPGTHDLDLLNDVLNKLANNQKTKLPRFNKATDNPHPNELWPEVEAVDVVIMEGWCWGVAPQNSTELDLPCNDLERNEDAQGKWRHYVNQQLQHYLAFYQQMDTWLMLKAPSFDCVHQWRWQQEQKLMESQGSTQNTKIMSQSDVARFIQYFQRLTCHGLNSLPATCDFVFELSHNRTISALRNKHVQ